MLSTDVDFHYAQSATINQSVSKTDMLRPKEQLTREKHAIVSLYLILNETSYN